MKQYLLGIVLFLLSSVAIAQSTVTLTCTLPTQNTDGTTLTDLDRLKLYESITQGGPYTEMIAQPSTDGCTFITPTLSAGMHYFVATAINVPGLESEYSGEASKDVPSIPVVPNPPGGLVILETDLVVYGISQTLDALVLYPVGTSPPGTPCDNTMTANGKYRVPWSSVIFAGTVKPYVVLASCGSGT